MNRRALRTKTETAYHDAGTAVASFVLRVKVDAVNIIPDPQSNSLR